MNKVKEKKLDAIKSDILEIREFVMSNSNNDTKQISNDYNFNDKVDDTITLTEIVNVENNVSNSNVLINIKQDLSLLKSTLIEHEQILNEILLKIK